MNKNNKEEFIKKFLILLSKKKYSENDNLLFEFYINIYLMIIKKRKIAQIFIQYNNKKNQLFMKNIIKILNNYYPYYLINKDKFNNYRFILYSKNYSIEKINKTFSEKYARDLGEFYVCAGNLNKIYKKYKYLLRPVISVFYENNYKKKLYCELFAQMCPPQICIRNFDKFMIIRNKFNRYLKKLNKKIEVNFELQKGWF